MNEDFNKAAEKAVKELRQEQAIKSIYGDVSLTSAPVDPENPGFDSLLGALEAVHNKTQPLEILDKYYAALSESNNAKKDELREALKSAPENADKLKIILTTLDLVTVLLESVKTYSKDPNIENMGECVSLFLTVTDKINKVRAAI